MKVISSAFYKSPADVRKIILTCRKCGIVPTGTIFLKSSSEIEKIFNLCEEYNAKLSASMFYSNKDDIEKVIKICQKYNIDVMGNMFKTTPEEVERIINICLENNMQISSSLFAKKSLDIENSIDFVKENYGTCYIKPLVVIHSKEHISEVFSYLDELGVLPTAATSFGILTLSLDEIKLRKQVLDNLGESITNSSKDMFHSIFGLCNKRFQDKYVNVKIKKKEQDI